MVTLDLIIRVLVFPSETSHTHTPIYEQMEHCTIEIHTGCNLYKAVDCPHRTHTNTERDERSQETHSPPNMHSETSLMIVMPQKANDTRFRGNMDDESSVMHTASLFPLNNCSR